MRKLSKYLFVNLFQTVSYALLVLLFLYALFDTLIEVGELVNSSKDFLVIFQYVLVRIPVYVYEIAPVAMLIGSIIALARLVRHNEYVVIKTSGVSLSRIAFVMIGFAFCVALLVGFLGERLVPLSDKITDQIISKTKVDNVSMLSKHNVWLKLDDEIIELREVLPDFSLKNVSRYQLIDNKKLGYIKFSKSGHYQGNNTWQLEKVSTIKFVDHRVVHSRSETEVWQPNLDLKLINILINKPKNMSVKTLRQYIDYLHKNHQKTMSYKIEMWKKIFYPWSMLVMALIALVFAPTMGRYSNVGLKMVLGILVGMVYFFSIRFIGFFTQITNINPTWVEALPTIVFMLILSVVLYYQDRGRMIKV